MWRSASLSYALGILGDVTRIAILVLLSVESIFLSDLVISHLLPRVLEHRAGVGNLLLLVLFAVPQVLYIALPLAVLVSSYLVLLRRKEANELVVIAGMGKSSATLIGGAILLGCLNAAASAALSGFVEPHANYQLERHYRQIGYAALANAELAAGKIYESGNYAVFLAGGRLSEVAESLFVHERREEQRVRVTVAGRSLRPGSAGDGIVLQNAEVFDFSTAWTDLSGAPASEESCTGCSFRLQPERFSRLNSVYTHIPGLLPPQPEFLRTASGFRTTWELLAQALGPDETRVLAERLLKALICLVAPLLALLSVTLTSRRTALLALPATAGLLLLASFFSADLVKLLVPYGLPTSAGMLVLLAVMTSIVLALSVRLLERRCLAPAGASL